MDKYRQLYNVKEFIKAKSKQFSVKSALNTYMIDDTIRRVIFSGLSKIVKECELDTFKDELSKMGISVYRYDIGRNDVDKCPLKFTLNKEGPKQELVDSIVILYKEVEEEELSIISLLPDSGANFISAPNETRANEVLNIFLGVYDKWSQL